MISVFQADKISSTLHSFLICITLILKIASLIPIFFVSLKFESVRRCFWCGQTCSEYFPRLPRISCRLMPSAYYNGLLLIRCQKQIFSSCSRFGYVDGREDAAFLQFPVEHEFHVSGAFEFLVNDIVHLASGVHKRRCQESSGFRPRACFLAAPKNRFGM